jgi:hypothetical protein
MFSDDASLSTMIPYSARHIGLSCLSPPVEAITYRGENIRLVNQCLSDPNKALADSAFLAVCGLIAYSIEMLPEVIMLILS